MLDKLDKTSSSKYADAQDIFVPIAFERPSITSTYSDFIDKVFYTLQLNRVTGTIWYFTLCGQ